MLPMHYSIFLLAPPENEPVKPKQQRLNELKKIDAMNLIHCLSQSCQVTDLRSVTVVSECSASNESFVFPDPDLNCHLLESAIKETPILALTY